MGYRPLLTCLALLGTIVLVSSLKCDNATGGHTCKQSMFVTGVCQSGQCGCVAGYTPFTYGCIENKQPVITAQYLPLQGIDGGHIYMFCRPIYRNLVYTWYRNGQPLNDFKTFRFSKTLSRSVDEGKYECTVNLNGVETERSKPFTLNFVKNESDASSFIKPELLGVPQYNKDAFRFLECASHLATGSLDVTYKFYVRGEMFGEVSGKRRKYWPLAPPTTSCGRTGPLTCSYTIGSVTVMSAEVPYPVYSDVKLIIYGSNYVKAGDNLNLNCKTSDDRGPKEVKGMTYSWFRDGRLIDSTNDYYWVQKRVTQKGSGAYMCVVSANGKSLASPEFQVQVVSARVSIRASPTDVRAGSGLALKCDVSLSNDVPVTYDWEIRGFSLKTYDNVLQMYDAAKFYGTTFTCVVGWKLDNQRYKVVYGEATYTVYRDAIET